MKPRIVIGITTYRDLRDAAIGAQVYDACAEVSPRLVPARASVFQQHHAVTNRDEFAALWYSEARSEVREGRTRTARVLERGILHLGAEWRSTGALNGNGNVVFRPERDNTQPDTLAVDHAFSPKVDWYGLLRKLVQITEPAYAMLHLFNGQGGGLTHSVEPDAFCGALTGEARFTSWKTPAGTWRKPDKWERAERRTYRYLPDLPWANYLGPEFSTRYDRAALREAAFDSCEMGEGVLFSSTAHLRDVLDPDTTYSGRQAVLKRAFVDGTFR